MHVSIYSVIYCGGLSCIDRLKSSREHTISGAILSSVRRVKYVINIYREEAGVESSRRHVLISVEKPRRIFNVI